MKTGDGRLDFRENSLKRRIYMYCMKRKGQFIHNGELQKEAMNSDKNSEGSTTKRRIQEMVKDGYLTSRYIDKELYVMYE